MPQVRAFQGVRYNPEIVQDLASVLAPPYDIIYPPEQKALYHSHPFNVVRVEHGPELPEDDHNNNRYTRAALTLREWLQEAVLRVEEKPALYLCHHSFTYQGRSYTRRELFALIPLEPWEMGIIIPHEKILQGPKMDRLQLLRACKANTSPVFGLYPDPEGKILAVLKGCEEQKPQMVVPRWREASFKMWVISDPQVIGAIGEALTSHPIYIADGHHRYEAALAYKDESFAKGPLASNHARNYVLAALTAITDPGLLILPIHRLIRQVGEDKLAELRSTLERDFSLQSLPLLPSLEREALFTALASMREAEVPSIGALGLETGSFIILRPRDSEALRRAMPSEWPRELRELDVCLLHFAILQNILGITPDTPALEDSLAFTSDPGEALQRVLSGDYQLAFFLNATKVNEVITVAAGGQRMPQKSTYFYPKPATGLVLNLLEISS